MSRLGWVYFCGAYCAHRSVTVSVLLVDAMNAAGKARIFSSVNDALRAPHAMWCANTGSERRIATETSDEHFRRPTRNRAAASQDLVFKSVLCVASTRIIYCP